MTEPLGAHLSEVPADRRRKLLVGALIGAVLIVSAVVYVRGGDRLTGSGGGVSASVTIDEEFHTMAQLETHGASLELVSARPVGLSEGLEADVQLVRVREADPTGSSRGPLSDAYEPIGLSGYLLQTLDGADETYWLDVTAVATEAGRQTMEGVEVTYRDGFLRERTAVIPMPLCLAASTDWRTAPDVDCPLPE